MAVECIIPRKWELKEPTDPADIIALTNACHVQPLIARLLSLRGISDPEIAKRFLEPTLAKMTPPSAIKDLAKAAKRIATAIKTDEGISILCDFDSDGCNANVVLLRALTSMGGTVNYYVPNRQTEGYGLSIDALRILKGQGASVVITVDNGITSVKEAICCKEELGIDLIITDHHLPGEELPDAYAIVNPNQPGCTSGLGYLCGAGVAFYLAIQVRAELRTDGWFQARPCPPLTDLLDLVAVATVADLVPIHAYENRLFVRHGLGVYNSPNCKPGLAALKEAAGIKGEVTSGQIAFFVGPRLNAAGRLHTAHAAIDLLRLDDMDAVTLLAKGLDSDNRERQTIEANLFDTAQTIVGDFDPTCRSIVVAIPDGHVGVIGIVASRIVERYHRPAIVIGIDPETGIGKGSCRSIPGLDLHDALSACSSHLTKWGGHKAAAGLTIASDAILAFSEDFDDACRKRLKAEDLIPTLYLDAELQPQDISFGLISSLENMEPHGMGNPRALFLFRNARMTDKKILKETHLKCTMTRDGESWTAIGFGLAKSWSEYEGPVDIACTIEVNEWRDKKSLQIMIKDIRPAEIDVPMTVPYF